jgi:hypothetical protein
VLLPPAALLMAVGIPITARIHIAVVPRDAAMRIRIADHTAVAGLMVSAVRVAGHAAGPEPLPGRES